MITTDDQTLQTLTMENAGVFIESGLTTALAQAKVEDKDSIVKTVTLHQVLLKTKAEIDQFCAGLKSLGVLNSIQENSQLFEHYFSLDGTQCMTAGMWMYV